MHIATFALSIGLTAALHATDEPIFFAAKPGSLAKAKERLAAGDKDLAKALKHLVEDADEALLVKPVSVMDKTKTPPSDNKHDYISLAPYYWPDPASKDGLPYIRHDGKVNPESRDEGMNDSVRIRLMGNHVQSLALAFYFTANEAYAAHAAKMVRTWFLDEATAMTPHMRFTQAILGVNDGRGTGILEGRNIATAADAMQLIVGSPSWTDSDRTALKAWLNAYLDWVLTSEPGKDEHAAKNNHGTFYDVQTVQLALCLGRKDEARRILDEAKQRRIAIQIEPDGKQPLELARTNTFSYSHFNLEALCALATLGEHAGVDLWKFTTADGRSIRKAIEFILPYANEPAKPWPFAQMKDKHDKPDFNPQLRQSSLAYTEPAFEAAITNNGDSRSKRFQLLFVK